MNFIDILLLPFVFIFRGFKLVLFSPYYIAVGLGKLFVKDYKVPEKKSQKNTISEIKPGEKVKVINTTRSAYSTPQAPYKETDPVKIAENKKQRTAKQQQEFEILVKKARAEEIKRMKEQERARTERAKKFAEKQKKEEEQRKKDEALEAKQIAIEEQKRKNGEAVGFFEKIKAWYKKATYNEKQELEYEAKKEVLNEIFSDKESKEKRMHETLIFNYIARNSKGEVEKSSIEALSRVDVHSFLLAEGYEVYEITPANSMMTTNVISFKLKPERLIFYLSQLSAYLKSGIALADSVKILVDQTKKQNERDTWRAVYYDLSMGDNLSLALEKRKEAFPKLLINMVKTAEMTGNLIDTLDDMVEYYTETENTKKQMKSAMIYPAVITVFAIAVVVFMLVYVVPEFTKMYAGFGAEPPAITMAVIAISSFLKQYLLYIALAVLLIAIIFAYCYSNVKSFKKSVQEILMHMPIIGNVMIYNEVTVFAKTFANLINHNVFITDSMAILNKITENEVYKRLIVKTTKNLTKGEPISKAFKDHWAFPNIAYQMLITGEKTGRLGTMMERVSNYYQEQHRNIINQMKSLIEPVLIVFLAVVVGGILLAVIIPMFSMYNEIK